MGFQPRVSLAGNNGIAFCEPPAAITGVTFLLQATGGFFIPLYEAGDGRRLPTVRYVDVPGESGGFDTAARPDSPLDH
jgi:hypothetical protein